jgi:hypothetical protein
MSQAETLSTGQDTIQKKSNFNPIVEFSLNLLNEIREILTA